MNDTVSILYIHNHDCAHKDEVVRVNPPCSDGVAFITHPTCIETETELAQKEVFKS